jgi:SOS response regulatory protein OraA/RecX
LKSIRVEEIEAKLKEKGYSEKVIKEIMRWYQN